MTEAMEYEDKQLVEEQLVEEPLEGEVDDFEDIDEEGDIAADAIEKVRATGRDEHMKPLSAYERKVVHDVVAAAGLYSESEGEGPRRHVVISLPGAGA